MESGTRFGKLTTIKNLGNRRWLCRCDCGTEKSISATNLGRNTNSCGCISKKNAAIHNMSNSAEYRAWHNAKVRCFWKKSEKFKNYGGRGITVCNEWKDSFSQFFSDMGTCPKGYSLERKDVNGNYDPSNCCWIPVSEQCNNKQNTLWSGDKTVKQIAHERGLNYYTLRMAHKRGEDVRTYIPKGYHPQG